MAPQAGKKTVASIFPCAANVPLGVEKDYRVDQFPPCPCHEEWQVQYGRQVDLEDPAFWQGQAGHYRCQLSSPPPFGN